MHSQYWAKFDLDICFVVVTYQNTNMRPMVVLQCPNSIINAVLSSFFPALFPGVSYLLFFLCLRYPPPYTMHILVPSLMFGLYKLPRHRVLTLDFFGSNLLSRLFLFGLFGNCSIHAAPDTLLLEPFWGIFSPFPFFWLLV